MRMSREIITPDKAQKLLELNESNRPISKHTVDAYARDICNGNWTENSANAIAISEDGYLQDGQHRLNAVIKAGIPVTMWVCYGCQKDAIYDSNRRRSNRDYLNMSRQDLPAIMRDTKFISMVRNLTPNSHGNVTSKEVERYIDDHFDDLYNFVKTGVISKSTKAKISVTAIFVSLYMAFNKGVDGDKIKEFYDILVSGISEKPEHYPIIAYRNFLLSQSTNISVTDENIKKCQGALKRFINKNCARNVYTPKEIFWDIRKEKNNE